jgi:hypothetical protein
MPKVSSVGSDAAKAVVPAAVDFFLNHQTATRPFTSVSSSTTTRHNEYISFVTASA